MRLSTWIKKTGPKKIAKLLSIDVSTVSGWKVKRQFPRPKHMVRIHQLSQGQVTYEEMITSYVKANR